MPPIQIAELAAHLDCQSWIGDPAFGVVLGSNLMEDRTSLLRDAAKQLGGSIRFFSRKDAGAPAIDFTPNPVERHVIELLKIIFDPESRLAPLPWQRPKVE